MSAKNVHSVIRNRPSRIGLPLRDCVYIGNFWRLLVSYDYVWARVWMFDIPSRRTQHQPRDRDAERRPRPALLHTTE